MKFGGILEFSVLAGISCLQQIAQPVASC